MAITIRRLGEIAMDKKLAKQQFEELTKKYDIKHTFDFDEAWGFVEYKNSITRISVANFESKLPYTPDEFKKGVTKLQKKIASSPNGVTGKNVDKFNPLRHFFADGCYIREIFNPAGELIVTKKHKISHPFFLLQGQMSILTEGGEQMIRAPFYSITEAGTKRVIYAHTDCIFVTVHVTDKTDIDEIEKDIIEEEK